MIVESEGGKGKTCPLLLDQLVEMSSTKNSESAQEPVSPGQRLANLLLERDLTVAVAESLTGGMLCAQLARVHEASKWFRGGVVAYSPEVKYEVLGVRRGPVVSEDAARDMAVGVARLCGASLGISVTGEAGPEPEEDKAPGTVWMAIAYGDTVTARLHHLSGSPEDILAATCEVSLSLACDIVETLAKADKE